MSAALIKEAKKTLAGKASRLEDQELEYLATEITKLGFKLGFARAYASGPSLLAKLVKELASHNAKLEQIQKILKTN
jgi:hypothetical protein